MYMIWNHKDDYHANSGFKSVADAWAHIRAFYNTDDYEVRPQPPNRPMEGENKMTITKRNPRGAGRPAIHPPHRKRHNLNIERDPGFDSCLLRVREMMAEQDGASVDQITQKSAVTYALYMMANRLPVKLPHDQPCPRCNGLGYLYILRGDDDQPCPECSE